MVVGEVAEFADVAIIGGGPGGYVAALRCADELKISETGRQVIVIERDTIGGACLNVGCIPSKVLIHAADVAALTSRSTEWGVAMTASVDGVKMRLHRRRVVDELTGGVRTLLDAAGVQIWSGHARFSKPNRLAVVEGENVRHLEFGQCIIATGSRPTPLPTLPYDGRRVIDSTGALDLDDVPHELVVVGAGYIGIELGTAWAKLGSRVTIIEGADRILPNMDARLSREVHRGLDRIGVTIHTGAFVSGSDDERLAPADKIIVAVGRTPNTDDLGLAAAGVRVGSSGHIEVTPDRRAAPRIFAIGDITAGPALAHKATAEAEVAAAGVGGRTAAFDPTVIPEVVFSDPEIASVGHSPATARTAGIEAGAFRFPFGAGSRSRTLGDSSGFVQLVADQHGTLIGAQMAGAGVTELIAEAALAIEMCTTAEELAATIHPHPTMSEAIAEAAHGLTGAPLHVRRSAKATTT